MASRYIIEGTDGIEYLIPTPPKKETIQGWDKPKKEQKWERPYIPDDNEIDEFTDSQIYEFIKRETVRRIFGFWFMNNGVPTYITGDHYNYLVHWNMDAENDTGYPEYRLANRDVFYFADICFRDELCKGFIFSTQKRFGKTEQCLSILFNRATTGIYNGQEVKGKEFTIQSVNNTDAKLLFKRVVRSWRKMPTVLLPIDEGQTDPQKELKFKEPSKRSTKQRRKYREVLNNTIMYRETTVTALQGKKPKLIYLDECFSIDNMDLEAWWKTASQQLSAGLKNITGKAMLAATVESMEFKSAAYAAKLWYRSDFRVKDANGQTKSTLYRMFTPYYMAMEGFIDEYGNPRIEECKAYMENKLANADLDDRITLERQYPSDPDKMFDIQEADGLEQDSIAKLNLRRKEIFGKKAFPYTITEYKGEVILEPLDGKEKVNTVWIIEHPKDNIKYKAAVDSTNVDANTSETTKMKSNFACAIGKEADAFNPYSCVAYYVNKPENRFECEKVCLLLSRYYAKFDKNSKMFKMYPERNAGGGSSLVSLYKQEGYGRLLQGNLVEHNTESEKVKSQAIGYYRDGNMMDYQMRMLNRWIQLNYMNIQTVEEVDWLLNVNKQGADWADAWQGVIIQFGNFDPMKKPKVKIEAPKQLTRTFVLENGQVLEKWI
jgi:hypothetical protein